MTERLFIITGDALPATPTEIQPKEEKLLGQTPNLDAMDKKADHPTLKDKK